MKRPPLRFGVAAARFNTEVTRRLYANCLKALRERAPGCRVETVWVPGSYELPWAAQELARSRRFDAVICLGAVLQGETPQNDHLAAAVLRALLQVSLSSRVPCVCGVITPRTRAQALARTRGSLDRGREAGLAAAEMALLRRALRAGKD